MDRFWVEDLGDPAPGAEVRLEGREAHHLARVKRLRLGDRVSLFDGAGREVEAEVARVGREDVLLVVRGAAAARELATRIALGVAAPKGKRAQVLVEKATELGAAAIFPLAAARTVVEGKPEKWRRWAIEAAKQSGVRRVPEIGEPRAFERALAVEADLRVILDPREGARPLGEILGLRPRLAIDPLLLPHELSESRASVLVLVGPEGGFTDEEVAAAAAAGFIPARLGPTILRVETAAIAAVAAIAVAMG